MPKRIKEFLWFIFPAYFVCLISLPSLLSLEFEAVSNWPLFLLYLIGPIITGAFLAFGQYWFSIFMIIAGGYTIYNSQFEQFLEAPAKVFGVYLILHFLICAIYVYYKKRSDNVT